MHSMLLAWSRTKLPESIRTLTLISSSITTHSPHPPFPPNPKINLLASLEHLIVPLCICFCLSANTFCIKHAISTPTPTKSRTAVSLIEQPWSGRKGINRVQLAQLRLPPSNDWRKEGAQLVISGMVRSFASEKCRDGINGMVAPRCAVLVHLISFRFRIFSYLPAREGLFAANIPSFSLESRRDG
ncbi:hypothetical protein BDV96DRAFT_395692 [Lophiotrema nucula]|uniref:Uncharacterized protein n=1 Tax=Lophiotrema nucula TaxID=690887 RepID=A0A6A5ZEQ2_9PLEO|nr:hypothetical protein BDV96DRAFT_395692 [Lophiotrema nucula]